MHIYTFTSVCIDFKYEDSLSRSIKYTHVSFVGSVCSSVNDGIKATVIRSIGSCCST